MEVYSGNYLEQVSTKIEDRVVCNSAVAFVGTYPTECVHMLTKHIHDNICSSTTHNIPNLETTQMYIYGKRMINRGTAYSEMLQSNENEKSICTIFVQILYKIFQALSDFVNYFYCAPKIMGSYNPESF